MHPTMSSCTHFSRIAFSAVVLVDIVPDSFRLALRYLPALKHQWRDLNFRVGPRFGQEAGYARKWRNDEASPFEYTRVLDPKPHPRIIKKTLKAAAKYFPVFEKAKIAQTWAGYIDVTPDAVPVIDPVDPTRPANTGRIGVRVVGADGRPPARTRSSADGAVA